MGIVIKSKKIIQNFLDGFDSYKPGYSVLCLFYDVEVVDIIAATEEFKNNLKIYAEEYLSKDIEDKEFKDVDPEPLFYIDENDLSQCISVVEFILVERYRDMYMKGMFLRAQATPYEKS